MPWRWKCHALTLPTQIRMQTHKKNHLSAALRRERSQDPGRRHPPFPGCLISSEINHAEGWGVHKSLKQTCKSNSTIYPARASSSEQGVGGTRQQNQPCPASSTFALRACGEETCGRPRVPWLPRLLADPRPGLFTVWHLPRTW